MKYLDLHYYKRFSARTPSVTTLDSPLLLDLPVSRDNITMRRPEFWAFAAAPDPDDDPRSFGFSRYKDGSGVASSEDTITTLLDAAKETADDMAEAAGNMDFGALGLDLGYGLSEADAWNKICVQKGKTIDYFIKPFHPGLTPLKLDSKFFEVLDHVIDVFADHMVPVSDFDMSPDPASTNGGFPFFKAGPVAKLASACLFSSDPNEMVAAAADWCAMHKLPEACALASGCSTRQGPVYKDTPEYELDQTGMWLARTMMKGHASRSRIVQMSPFCVNMALRPLYYAFQEARKRIRGTWRTVDEDLTLHSESQWYHYEADISAFDASMSIQVQAAIATAIIKRVPSLEAVTKLWLAVEQRPLITPSWALDDSRAEAVFPVGGISSGYKFTSGFGTLASIVLNVYAISKQRKNWREWPAMVNLRTSHQGDDVRVSSREPLDTDAYTASFAELGFKCELRPGYVFLSKHIVPGYPLLPIAGRLVQQTCFHEHEPTIESGPGLLYLGFISRFQNFEYLSPLLQDAVWRVIQHVEWIRNIGARSVNEVLHYIAKPAGQRAIARAVTAAASTRWVDALTRDAEYSFADAQALTWITQRYPEMILESYSLRQHLDVLSLKVGTTFSAQQKADLIRWLEDLQFNQTGSPALKWQRAIALADSMS